MSARDTTYRFEHTRVVARFYLHDRTIVVDGANADVGSIIACTTSKAFGAPEGTWTMTVKRIPGAQPSWLTQVPDPEDVWVLIQWIVNGVVYDGMWGLTNSWTETVTRSENGARTETVTITGSDHGKCFSHTPLFINIHEQNGALPVYPLYLAVAERLRGTPTEIVRTLIDAWLGNQVEGSPAPVNDKQWLLPSGVLGGTGEGRFFYEFCRFDTMSETRGETFAPSLLSPDREGATLWDTLQEYMNGALNEMWTDLGPAPDTSPDETTGLRPCLFMRERPFPTIRSRARWDALPRRVLTPRDVRNRTIVSDGAQRFNYWEMTIEGLSGTTFDTRANIQQITGIRPGQPGNVPIYDLDSIRKHGLRRHTESTRYLPTATRAEGVDTVAPWLQVAAVWQRIIHDWFVISPLQYTGTITTSYLIPTIRIGDVLREERADGTTWEYYVEGVSHTYTYPREGVTTVTLTRGQPLDADYLSEHYARIAGLDVSTLSDEEVVVAVSPTAAIEEGAAAGASGVVEPPTPDAALAAATSAPVNRVVLEEPFFITGVITPPDEAENAPITDADLEAGLPVDPFDDPLAGIEGIDAPDLEGLDGLGSPNRIVLTEPFVVEPRRARTPARTRVPAASRGRGGGRGGRGGGGLMGGS